MVEISEANLFGRAELLLTRFSRHRSSISGEMSEIPEILVFQVPMVIFGVKGYKYTSRSVKNFLKPFKTPLLSSSFLARFSEGNEGRLWRADSPFFEHPIHHQVGGSSCLLLLQPLYS